ncbi:hypothetical protein [Cohnella panacarvi]|uniref:hypothetical protein n=1 Tax=Cohnella panacarvi TaxID=400776 RepID=UPI00047EABF3|nr:hypothetical protein [Cohnella panacarvi]
MEQAEGDRAVPIAADETAADRAKGAVAITQAAGAEAMAPDEADGETAPDVRDQAKGQGDPGRMIVRLETVAARASREAEASREEEARTARGGPARPEALRLETDRVRRRSRPWSIRRPC